MDSNKQLSLTEREEFGYTDAKICALRLLKTISLYTDKEITGNLPPEVIKYNCKKGELETLFSTLSESDPHYEEAGQAKKKMEAFLESLNALDVNPRTCRP